MEETQEQMLEADGEIILNDGDLSQYEISEDGMELSLSEKTRALAEITVDAIKNSSAFSEFFDNISLISCYGKSGLANKGKESYIIFRANDAVSGRRVVVKCTNPAFTSAQSDGGRALENALEWEESAIRFWAEKSVA